MGEVTAPDGRRIWIPDFAAPFVPEAPPESSPGDPYWDPSAGQIAFASGRPDMPAPGESTNPVTGGGAFTPLPAPTPQVPNPQFEDYGHSSPMAGIPSASGGMGPSSGIARIAQAPGPVGTIGQIGKATALDQQARGMPLDNLGNLSADLASVTPPPAPPPLTPAQQKFNASPEGQAQMAGQQGQQAISAQEQVSRAQGAVEGKEMADVAANQQEGFDRAEKVRADAEAAAKARQEGIAQRQADLERMVQQEASTKIDDNRRWTNLDTGRKLVAVMAMAFSGLGEALMGKSGPNPVIGMIDKAIQDDVNAQVRERDQAGKRIGYAKTSLDNYRDIAGSEADAYKLKLSEEYDRTAQQVRVTSSKYASPKAKLQGEMIAQQLAEKAAALRGQTAEGMYNRDIKRQELGIQRQQVGIAGGHLALANREFAWNKDYQQKQLNLEAAKLENAGQGQAAAIVAKQAVPGLPQSVQDPQTGEVKVVQGGLLRQSDGSIFVAPTEKEGIEAREKVNTAAKLMSIIDEIRDIRDRVGGESSWGNSTDYQRLQVLKDQAVAIRKAGTQGMSSDADMQRIERMLGADNPASFRSQAGKLDEARNQIVKQVNSDLHIQYGYSGKDLDWADPLKNRAPMSADQEQARQIETFSLKTADPERVTRELGLTPEALASAGSRAQSVVQDTLAKQPGGILPSAKTAIDNFASMARSPGVRPADQQRAGATLGNLAKSAQDPAVRAYALSKLQEIQTADASLGASPDITGPITSTRQVD